MLSDGLVLGVKVCGHSPKARRRFTSRAGLGENLMARSLCGAGLVPAAAITPCGGEIIPLRLHFLNGSVFDGRLQGFPCPFGQRDTLAVDQFLHLPNLVWPEPNLNLYAQCFPLDEPGTPYRTAFWLLHGIKNNYCTPIFLLTS